MSSKNIQTSASASASASASDCGSFIPHLIKAVDSSISDESIQSVLQSLQFPVSEFWNLAESDIISILGDENKEQASNMFIAQQYLKNVESWNKLNLVIQKKDIETILSDRYDDRAAGKPLETLRTSEFVEHQLLKVTPKKCETLFIFCRICVAASWRNAGRRLLASKESVAHLMDVSSCATTNETIRWWCSAIKEVVAYNSRNSDVKYGIPDEEKNEFRTRKFLETLLQVGNRINLASDEKETTKKAKKKFSQAFCKIIAADDTGLTVASAKSEIGNECILQLGKAFASNNIITLLTQKLLGSESVLDALLLLQERIASSCESITSWLYIIWKITEWDWSSSSPVCVNQDLFGTSSKVRDAFINISQSKYFTDSAEIDSHQELIANYFGVISNLTGSRPSVRSKFVTEQLRDSFIVASKSSVKSDSAVRWFCSAFANALGSTDINSSLWLDSYSGIKEGIICVVSYIHSPNTACEWNRAVKHLQLLASSTNTNNNNKQSNIFVDTSLVNAFVSVSKSCSSDRAVLSWSNTIDNLVNDSDESSKKLFGVESIRNAFVSISQYATSSQSIHFWIAAINHMTLCPETHQAFYNSAVFKQVVTDLKKRVEEMSEDADTKEAKKFFSWVESKFSIVSAASAACAPAVAGSSS